MSIFPYDLPQLPATSERTQSIPAYSPQSYALESYMYMESKPYARPLEVGLNPVANNKWIGYANYRVGWGRSDDNAVTVPPVPITKKPFNSTVPYPTNASFAGQAPVKGIFTGVSDEVAPCR